jgi:phytoene desaturase
MEKKTVGVLGAGPGGLACAMILAHNGFDVTVFEKAEQVGGRNAALKIGDFTFDTGPTFLNMKFVLDEVFQLCDRLSSDYLEFKFLDPMYQLVFHDKKILINSDKEKMRQELEKVYPGNLQGLNRFYEKEKQRFHKIMPNLEKDFGHVKSFFSPTILKALPYLFTRGSIYDNLGKYFKDEDLRICFTFQSKYLGMSPWECPAAFTMIPYVEHEFGIYHIIGGLNQLSKAMRKVLQEEGGKVETSTPIERLIISDRTVSGLKLKDGRDFSFDNVVINSDFGYSFTKLVESTKLKKFTPKKIAKKKYSCSTFMLYLGVDKKYPEPHHNIIFAKDYKTNIYDIGKGKLSEDFSFYIQNASTTDPTLAPEGKSTIYALVPVANNFSNINWTNEKAIFREKVLDAIETKTSMNDLRDHIEVERMITPDDWENSYNVYKAATFNLAHNLGQMLYFRPHNQFDDLKNCYLVGGGTHPGSGLPTIYLSSIISAGLIAKKYGKKIKEKPK